MTSREISTKSLTIYFQNMMNDGIHLASNSTPEQYSRLVWIKGASRALNFGVLKTWDRLAHLLPVARTRSQFAKTASLGIWMKHIRLNFHKNISKSNQIKSNQITFIVTSPQHMCFGEWNSWERAPDSAETIYI